MLAGMGLAFGYQAQFKGKPVAVKQLKDGAPQRTLPAGNESGTLVIYPVGKLKG